MGFPTGAQIQSVENLGLLVTTSTQGTTNAEVVPLGRIVAVTGFSFYSTNPGTLTINNGDGVNQWRVEVTGPDTIVAQFDHPLLMDGVLIELSGGGTQQWAIAYKDLGQPAQ